MIIQGRYIRSLERHIGFLDEGRRIAIGARLDNVSAVRLREAGFSEDPEEGETVLPRASLGSTSAFNAEGRYIKHRDRPMETAYQQIEWTWTEWHGPYREERSEIRDRPYKRYPRTFVPPPSVELTVASTAGVNQIIVTPEYVYRPNQHDAILHAINLILELAGECEIFTGDLDEIVRPEIRRVNWEILPPGRLPWAQRREQVREILDETKPGNRVVIEDRLETINQYGPDFVAVGRAGFRGYLIFGFPERNLYACESTLFDNATYVFSEEWETLSQLTKAEILSEDLHEDRVIHRRGWKDRIRTILG